MVLYSNIFASYLLLFPCFTLILGIFHMIPFIWVITLQNRKTLFCVFLTFRDLRELKKPGIFSEAFFLEDKELEHLDHERGGLRPI